LGSWITGKTVTVPIRDMTSVYVLFIIISSFFLTALGYKDRQNKYFYKTKDDVASINSLGVSTMAIVHIIIIYLSQLTALYFTDIVKQVFFYPRLVAISVCFFPFIIIYFLFIRVKFKI